MTAYITINGRFLTQSITGVQRYAIEIVKALDNLFDAGDIDPDQISFELLAPRGANCDLRLKHIPLRCVGHLSGHLWEQFELPFYVGRKPLISLCNAAPLLKRNQIVTIHDASVFANPRTYPFAFRAWYKFLLRGICRAARKIVTDSSFSKSEIMRYCGIDESRIQVILLGKEHIFAVPADAGIIERNQLSEKPYILAVSSVTPNKNFRSIVRAIELLDKVDFDIVIAGGANPRVFSQSDLSLPDTVKHLGYVSDGELRALYEHAACFVFPSFYEGFGLPPLEAMACGCPVIVSNAASLPEVCGDAALYCDPHSPEDIAAKISQLIHDPALQDDLRGKGLERAALYSWDKTAKMTMEVLEEALDE